MAATVGANSPATFIMPLRNAGIGPFLSSAGSVYICGRTSGSPFNSWKVFKATDPIAGTWTQVVSTNPGGTSANEAMSVVQVGDTLHVLGLNAAGVVIYRGFDMSADAWLGAGFETVVTATNAPAAGSTFCSVVARSDGSLVAVFNSGATASMGTLHNVKYSKRSAAGTWDASQTAVDNGGSINWVNPVAILGASDRVHIFFKDATNNRVYQRTLSAANALETFPGAGFDTTVTTDVQAFGQGVSYSSGANVRAPYLDAGPKTSVAQLTSADAPTVSVTANISDGAPKVTNSQGIHFIVADGTTLHAIYSDGTSNDMMHDQNSGAGWGTDVNELAATINTISGNVYTRSGSTYLAMFYDDAGTIKYAEIALGGAPPPAADAEVIYAPPTPLFY